MAGDKQTLITFALFSVEAYFHFLIGKGADKLVLPSIEESLKMFGTVFIFSIMSTYLTKRLA